MGAMFDESLVRDLDFEVSLFFLYEVKEAGELKIKLRE